MDRSCKQPPKYLIKRAPTADCQRCRDLWAQFGAPKSEPATLSLAATMIAKARQKPPTNPDPSAEMLAELRTICEYNDGAAWMSKVSVTAVIDMLNASGWPGSRHALNNLCSRALGRKSFGQP